MNTFLHDMLVKTTIYSVTDKNGNIIEVNDKFCEVTQYSREELIGKNHKLINSGVHDAELFKDLWETVLSGNIWKNEICNRSKDGTLNWFDTIITPEANELGEYVKFYAYRTLITDKKNQELKLQESEKRFALAISATKDGVWDWDVNSNIIFVSKRWLEIMDCNHCASVRIVNESEFEINFEDWIDLINVNKKEYFLEVTDKHLSRSNNSNNKDLDFAVKTKNDRWIRVLAKSIYDINQNPIRVIGTITDITEFKKYQEDLLEHDKLLKELSNKIPGFFYKFLITTDGKTYFPYSSDGIKDIYEVTPIEAASDALTIYNRIFKEDYDYVVKSITDSAENLTVWKEEYRVVLPIKGLRWLKGIARPTKLENGDILWYGYISDITDTKQYEIELIKAKEKAEESDKLKTAFIANMSHEIRTPMNGIIGFSQFLAEPDLPEDERIEFANILGKSTKRLLNLVEDIINISRLEANAMEIDITSFNLNELLDEIYKFFSGMFKTNNIEFILENGLEYANANIKSDESKLQKIISNLLNNSYKFTTSGKVKFGYTVNLIKGTLDFYIEDTGIGIDEQFLNRIYDVFAQEDLSLNRMYEGAGLGIPLVKGYLKLLKGDVNIISQKGKGTRVEFYIPLNIENNEE